MASAVAAAVVLAVAEPAVLAAVVAEPAPAAELAPSTAAAVAPLPAVAAAAAVRWKLQHIAPVQSVAAVVAAAAQVPCTVPCQPLSPPARCPRADELSLSWIPWWQSVLASSAPPVAVVAAVGGSHMLGRLGVDPEQGNSTECSISKSNLRFVPGM